MSIFQTFACFWLCLSSIGGLMWFLGPRTPTPFHSSQSLWAPCKRCDVDIPEGSGLTCRLEMPTAVMIPNITRYMPPITGLGMVANAAPIFPKTPMRSSTQPAATITILLPTCSTQETGDKEVNANQATHPRGLWPAPGAPGTMLQATDRTGLPNLSVKPSLLPCGTWERTRV